MLPSGLKLKRLLMDGSDPLSDCSVSFSSLLASRALSHVLLCLLYPLYFCNYVYVSPWVPPVYLVVGSLMYCQLRSFDYFFLRPL